MVRKLDITQVTFLSPIIHKWARVRDERVLVTYVLEIGGEETQIEMSFLPTDKMRAMRVSTLEVALAIKPKVGLMSFRHPFSKVWINI